MAHFSVLILHIFTLTLSVKESWRGGNAISNKVILLLFPPPPPLPLLPTPPPRKSALLMSNFFAFCIPKIFIWPFWYFTLLTALISLPCEKLRLEKVTLERENSGKSQYVTFLNFSLFFSFQQCFAPCCTFFFPIQTTLFFKTNFNFVCKSTPYSNGLVHVTAESCNLINSFWRGNDWDTSTCSV